MDTIYTILEFVDIDNDDILFYTGDDRSLFIQVNDNHTEEVAAVLLEEEQAKKLLAFLKKHYEE